MASAEQWKRMKENNRQLTHLRSYLIMSKDCEEPMTGGEIYNKWVERYIKDVEEGKSSVVIE